MGQQKNRVYGANVRVAPQSLRADQTQIPIVQRKYTIAVGVSTSQVYSANPDCHRVVAFLADCVIAEPGILHGVTIVKRHCIESGEKSNRRLPLPTLASEETIQDKY